MFGSIKKLARNRKGAFAIQFALMAVPLTVCTGLAIDGGRVFLAHYELASALDAAALAAGSTLTQGADLNAVAAKFVDANFHTPHDGVIGLTLDNSDPDVLKLNGKVRILTYFMPLVGQPYVDVSAASEVRRGGNNVEVSLALDITQSMNSPSTKIAALRTAATDLIDEVINTVQTPYFSRAAIVPWGTNLHLGSYADAIRGPVTGTTSVSAAIWRNGTAKNLATGTGWRTNTGKALSAPGITWKNGSSFSISKVTKTGSPLRVQITVTGTPSTLANGDFVYLSGITTPSSNSYTYLNGNRYMLADKSGTSTATFNLKDTAGAYLTAPSGSTNATVGATQECFSLLCELQVTATSHGFANGDYINIQGITTSGSGTDPNNTATTTYTIGSVATNTFILTGASGPTYKGWSSGGTASKCYTTDCKYRVTTSAAHGLTDGDFVYINGATLTGSAPTTINNTAGTTWTVSGATGSIFYLPGTGANYKEWSSVGTVSECYTSTCEVQVTSAGHGLAVNDWVQIASVGGMTGLNYTTSVPAWQVKSVSGNDFVLSGTVGPSYSAYTSGGTAQCLKEGCQKMRFLAADNSYQIKSITNCGTERTGTYAHTDESPSTAFIGRDYAGAGSLVGCVTGTPGVSGNYLTPLTSDKTALKKAITDMTVSGSTAGQIGAEWAWYMLSPKWASIWPGTATDPMPYGTHELAKVAILMTDGAFNTAHCKGVTTDAYSYSSVADSDKIAGSECTAADTPFNLAQATCTAMKAANIAVYTVGFEVGSEPGAADFLTACATDSHHVFLAADETALKAAFKSIATSISKLRISK